MYIKLYCRYIGKDVLGWVFCKENNNNNTVERDCCDILLAYIEIAVLLYYVLGSLKPQLGAIVFLF
jgi:hypothetical protein